MSANAVILGVQQGKNVPLHLGDQIPACLLPLGYHFGANQPLMGERQRSEGSELNSVAMYRFLPDFYLQSNFIQLGEREDGLLHHVHTLILQQHVEVGDQAEEEFIVPFTVNGEMFIKLHVNFCPPM